MSLTVSWNAVRGTGLLPVFALVALVLAMVAAAAGAWAGMKWERGAAAIADNRALRADIRDLGAAAQALRADKVRLAQDYAAAVERQEQIAKQVETDRERNREYFEGQRQALAELVAGRPDLGDRAGADVLQHWRRANAGAAASAAPAAPAPASDGEAELPRPAAAVGRSLADADRKPRRRRGALPRLPRGRRRPRGGNGRMADHGMGLVLRRHRAARAGRFRVRA